LAPAVKLKALVELRPVVSITVTMPLSVPATAGAPLSAPVDEEIVRPGKPFADQVSDPVPPVAEIVSE
jgi:hypothetical protein